MSYNRPLIQKAIKLRSEGLTYSEIRSALNLEIPKGTLHSWFKEIVLPKSYYDKVSKLNLKHLRGARLVAAKANKIKRQEFLDQLDKVNLPIAGLINNYEPAKIALAMLCLGEASKYKPRRSFNLGSSDSRIIIIFLVLLRKCFNFNQSKVRCTVQCRADQSIEELERFWQDVTKIPKAQFYKAQIDPRTIGKPTKKENYKGVLRIDYLDIKVQLELESLAKLVYNQVKLELGPVA
jgi:hypothetical protein